MATPELLTKKTQDGSRSHNIEDYGAFCATFQWTDVREELSGLPDGCFNIAYEAVDRHADGANASTVAIRWLGKKGQRRDLTYAELKAETAKFANALDALGVQKGDRVFALIGRVPEVYVAALGTLKAGAVFCPLFSAFGPEPIHARMEPGDARVLITTPLLYKRKIAGLRERLPTLEHVLLVDPKGRLTNVEGTKDFRALMAEMPAQYVMGNTHPEDPALLHFTSGTTGKPKGALHVHEAGVVHYATGRQVLDLQDGDVFWCTADPGWVTGTSYGIIAPLMCGVTNLVVEAEFDTKRWYKILAEEEVSVWYTAPTAIRMLMKAGTAVAQERAYPALRHMVSVGEPLNPNAVVWGQEAFGMPFHDTWWQTETGGIMMANYPCEDIKPGSMGKPLPGITAAIVNVDASDGKGSHRNNFPAPRWPARRARKDGRCRNSSAISSLTDAASTNEMAAECGSDFCASPSVEIIDTPDTEGMLALKTPWPSMFRTYLHNETRYRGCFADGWYLSGDLARKDADGYFWFVGRADDVIKSAGHLIGPFEVESALMEHPAVAEVGVIGKPDPMAGAVIKAFVSLKEGYESNEALRLELVGFSRKRLGPAVAPREIDFMDGLPKTRSGKIMRRLLLARELGLPEGDTSTLEGGS